jgi:ATP-dependent helicase/nuclease subunit A
MRRAVTPGDVMILVQRRNALFSAIIRELKSRGLDVAGADRLRLRAELAVRDVEACLRVLALPEDDLSLACALKSPLFGWDEAALYRLAQPRPPGQTLWQALERAEPTEALAILQDLRGPRRLPAPLRAGEPAPDPPRRPPPPARATGPRGEDGLDAFLAQALAYESQSVPSLTGFLEWRGQDEAEVKRQMDAAGDRIRVMTVHGAKGLEAPIVILPDCGDRRDPSPSALLPMPDGTHLWRGARDEAPAPLRARMEALAEAGRRERRRLLYVAMTRAESWLVVCAAGGCGPTSWHAQVAAGLDALEAAEHDFPTGPGRCHGGPWDHLPVAPDQRPARAALVEPPVFAPVAPPGPAPPPAPPPPSAAPPFCRPRRTRPTPRPEATRARALARGALIHLALEHLPYAPPALVRPLLAATEDAGLAGDLDEIVADAQALIAAPDLAPLWGSGRAGRGVADRRDRGPRPPPRHARPAPRHARGRHRRRLQDQPGRPRRARGGPRGGAAPDGRLPRAPRGALPRPRGARGRSVDPASAADGAAPRPRHGRLAPRGPPTVTPSP